MRTGLRRVAPLFKVASMSRTPLVLKILSALLLLVAPCFGEAATSPRERISFNDNWRFRQGDLTNAVQPAFPDNDWRQLNLPHDWAIEGPVKQEYAGETAKLKYWGPVWYRKHFEIPATDAGKKIFLDIDGAMSRSEVSINGHPVGGWPYGYTSFELDLTPYIKFGGENVLAIRLDTPPDASRWYPGAGIYRNVWLVKTAPIHVDYSGTFVTTPTVTPSAAEVKIVVNVVNDGPATTVSVKNEIFSLDANGRKGKPIAPLARQELDIADSKTTNVTAHLTVNHPQLWSVTKPNRYVVVTSIERDGKILDQYETPFGIRTIEFTVDQRFSAERPAPADSRRLPARRPWPVGHGAQHPRARTPA